MTKHQVVIVVWGIVAVVVGGIIALGLKGWRDRRLRTQTLLGISTQMALSFDRKGDGNLPGVIRELRGKRATIFNIIHGQYYGSDLCCLDIHDHGDESSSWETIVALKLNRSLPELHLAPNDRFAKVIISTFKFAAIFNRKLRERIRSEEITFDDDSLFAKAYFAETKDQALARECLSPEFRVHLVSLPHRWDIWMRAEWLVMTCDDIQPQKPSGLSNDRRVAPERIPDFIQAAHGIAKRVGQ